MRALLILLILCLTVTVSCHKGSGPKEESEISYQALLAAVPKPGRPRGEMHALQGEQPSPSNPPTGCPFHPRCPHATERCARECPTLQGASHKNACFLQN